MFARNDENNNMTVSAHMAISNKDRVQLATRHYSHSESRQCQRVALLGRLLLDLQEITPLQSRH
jgi:hypothetical protein